MIAPSLRAELAPKRRPSAISPEDRERLLAAGVSAPEGRLVVEGEVVSLKWHDNDYGGSLKMVVRSVEGWACWGSAPKAIRDTVQRGDRVRFTVTLERASDDQLFAFSKRPAKAEIV